MFARRLPIGPIKQEKKVKNANTELRGKLKNGKYLKFTFQVMMMLNYCGCFHFSYHHVKHLYTQLLKYCKHAYYHNVWKLTHKWYVMAKLECRRQYYGPEKNIFTWDRHVLNMPTIPKQHSPRTNKEIQT